MKSRITAWRTAWPLMSALLLVASAAPSTSTAALARSPADGSLVASAQTPANGVPQEDAPPPSASPADEKGRGDKAGSGPAQKSPKVTRHVSAGSAKRRAAQTAMTAGYNITNDTEETDNFDGSQDFSPAPGWPIPNWDTYIYRSDGPVTFNLSLPYRGPTDPIGTPTEGNIYFGDTASVIIHDWDVDEYCAGYSSSLCESDRVSVNGQVLDGQLHGADGDWDYTTLAVPASTLRFGTAPGQFANNTITISVDVLNSQDTWAMQVDEFTLRLPGHDGQRPVVLFHGLGSDFSEMNEIEAAINAQADVLGQPHPVILKVDFDDTLGHSAGLDVDLSQATPHLTDFLETAQAAGWTKVNFLGHSMGGVVARAFASQMPDRVNKVIIIGTPNGGVGPADAACNVMGGIAHQLNPQFCFPGAIRDIQTGVMRDIINKQYPEMPGVDYETLAGTDNTQGCIWPAGSWNYDEPSDSCVPVFSAEYLLEFSGHGGLEHGGINDFGPDYEWYVDHAGETNRDGGWRTKMLCLLWGETCAPQPGALGAPTADPSIAESSGISTDAALIEDRIIQPDATDHFAVAFEGASRASVQVIASASGVTATIGTTALTASTVTPPYTLSANLTSPADGVLDVTNTGASPVHVRTIVSISTSRHLTLSLGTGIVSAGAAVPIEVQISETATGDSPVVMFVDAQGGTTSIPVVGSGPGVWTGTVSSNVLGTGTLDASVTQNGPRFANRPIVISAGVVTAAGMTQATSDVDGDGLFDALDVSTVVTVPAAGTFIIEGALKDSTGRTVAVSNAVLALAAGSQTVPMSFAGQSIFGSGISGPYTVAVTIVDRTNGSGTLVLGQPSIGDTSALDFRDFQHDVIALNADMSVAGVDSDSNGYFESLDLTGTIEVETAGQYAIDAVLWAPSGTEIARAAMHLSLAAGTSNYALSFDRAAIFDSGYDGPFTVHDLYVYQTDGNGSATGGQYLSGAVVSSAPYTHSQFAPPPLDTTPPTSHAGPLGDVYTSASISVPYSATDEGGSGVASVELWVRYRPNEAQAWGPYALGGTGDSSPLSYGFASGDGNYEFYTVAVDSAGNRETAPTVADAATRRDAVDDPPDVTFSASAWRNGSPTAAVNLLGGGTAADDRSLVTVTWQVYGVKANGQRQRLFSFKPAVATDGTFDSRIEAFRLEDYRSGTWVSYDIDVRVTAGSQSVTRTMTVEIFVCYSLCTPRQS